MLGGSTDEDDWANAQLVETDALFDSGGVWNSDTLNEADFLGYDTTITPDYLNAASAANGRDTFSHSAFATGGPGMSL